MTMPARLQGNGHPKVPVALSWICTDTGESAAAISAELVEIQTVGRFVVIGEHRTGTRSGDIVDEWLRSTPPALASTPALLDLLLQIVDAPFGIVSAFAARLGLRTEVAGTTAAPLPESPAPGG